MQCAALCAPLPGRFLVDAKYVYLLGCVCFLVAETCCRIVVDRQRPDQGQTLTLSGSLNHRSDDEALFEGLFYTYRACSGFLSNA